MSDPDRVREAWDIWRRAEPDRALAEAADPLWRLGMTRGNWLSVDVDRADRTAAIPVMIALLQDRDPNNRSHAARRLGERGATAAIEPLAAALHADDPGLRPSAAVALARLGDARGLEEILRLPRSTPILQSRMSPALLALNFLRQPETARSIAAISWERDGRLEWPLREALGELSRRSGMKLRISKAIPEHQLRRPLDWPELKGSWDVIATHNAWSNDVAFILEPDEIRVLTPLEASSFWEVWSRARLK
jgi:hypothetical protein